MPNPVRIRAAPLARERWTTPTHWGRPTVGPGPGRQSPRRWWFRWRVKHGVAPYPQPQRGRTKHMGLTRWITGSPAHRSQGCCERWRYEAGSRLNSGSVTNIAARVRIPPGPANNTRHRDRFPATRATTGPQDRTVEVEGRTPARRHVE